MLQKEQYSLQAVIWLCIVFNEQAADDLQELTPQYRDDSSQSQAHLLSLSMNIHMWLLSLKSYSWAFVHCNTALVTLVTPVTLCVCELLKIKHHYFIHQSIQTASDSCLRIVLLHQTSSTNACCHHFSDSFQPLFLAPTPQLYTHPLKRIKKQSAFFFSTKRD